MDGNSSQKVVVTPPTNSNYNTSSDNSLVIHDDVDTFFLSQSSRLSEDSGSIVSYPNSDVMNSLVATPEISYQDEHERKVPIMPAPVEYTPIITKVDENETDPPPIFIINNETQLFQCTTWFSKY
ncbi:5234_t:CDS:2 [Entrophospora sp. SA101]|nr:5234_t:CDS:2 [Entrophospora sp. SA101]